MTISALGSMPTSQLQALAVTNVVESSSTSQASDQTASLVVKVASGVRVSGRTAQSLTDILQASQTNLGYSKEQTKSFTTMIDAARKYLDNIKQWAAGEAAAAASTDPAKNAIDAQFQATEEGQKQMHAVQTYDSDFIAKMEKGLDQVMSAFADHTLVFQSFSIGATDDVNIMAKTFKTGADGKMQTDLSFSFFQNQIKDEKQPQTNGPPQYGTMWSVNDLTLFNTGADRVL